MDTRGALVCRARLLPRTEAEVSEALTARSVTPSGATETAQA